MNQGDPLGLAESAARIEIGKAHAPQAEFGNIQTLIAQLAYLHETTPEIAKAF
jgi:hypothetical protein